MEDPKHSAGQVGGLQDGRAESLSAQELVRCVANWENDAENKVDEKIKERSAGAFRIALIEFAAVFVSELIWNFFRKMGGSTIDFFGIAVITAIFTYFVERERKK